MGVQTHTMVDLISPIGPARLFKALAIYNHETMPKAMPKLVKSSEFVEGDSTIVGCIKQLNFHEGGPFKYLKVRVDEIDFDNFYIKYTTIESDILEDKWECVVYEHKYETSGSGSHYKLIAHLHPKGDHVMKEEELNKGKEMYKKVFKAVEEYLLTNPQIYA